MVAGIGAMAAGFAAFALSVENSAFYALDAILIGVAIAAISAVGPVFIVGAGLNQRLEARRMTMYSLAMPAGQVAGGILIGAASRAGWSFTDRFWLSAVVIAAAFVVVLLTTKAPADRLNTAIDSASPDTAPDAETARPAGVTLRTVLASTFGLFLAISILTSLANNGINNQISNLMPNLYGISESGTSTLIAVAGVLNIVLFFPAGRWMARSGSLDVYQAGLILRLVGALGMAATGLIADAPALLAVASMQLLYQGSPFARLAQPSSAMRFATFPAGAANGWLIAGSAIGSFLGSVLGGILAERFGFNAVNWMAVAAAAGSVVLFVATLRPRDRRDNATMDVAATGLVPDG